MTCAEQCGPTCGRRACCPRVGACSYIRRKTTSWCEREVSSCAAIYIYKGADGARRRGAPPTLACFGIRGLGIKRYVRTARVKGVLNSNRWVSVEELSFLIITSSTHSASFAAVRALVLRRRNREDRIRGGGAARKSAPGSTRTETVSRCRSGAQSTRPTRCLSTQRTCTREAAFAWSR